MRCSQKGVSRKMLYFSIKLNYFSFSLENLSKNIACSLLSRILRKHARTYIFADHHSTKKKRKIYFHRAVDNPPRA